MDRVPSKPVNVRDGFTLIELMIVVSIIGILAAIAIPKFADLVRKSKEGSCKGNLGAFRGALNIYYGDNEGLYPANPSVLVSGRQYISANPIASMPYYHPDTAGFTTGFPIWAGGIFWPGDLGSWFYDNQAGTNSTYGFIIVACVHTDSKGSVWSEY